MTRHWRIQFPALVLLVSLIAIPATPVLAAPTLGKLSGVVVDPAGVPQMGASVWVSAEETPSPAPVQLLTNDRGLFRTDRLLPGWYSVRVTLAGFLPALHRHVRVDANFTTVLKIELDSLLTSFDRLRRRPNQEVEADEWTWVLRTSAATRPVLRWVNGEVGLEGESARPEGAKKRKPHGRLELTSGARRPGSISNLADAPSSAFAYEQKIGHLGRLLMAGQVSYERSATAGLATTWLPAGEAGRGPEMSLVLRQAKLGPGGPTFRGVRLKHGDELSLGERFTLRYGAEYVLMGLGRSTSTLRPLAELVFQITPHWRASLMGAARPWLGMDPRTNTLEATLAHLDAFPALLVKNGLPVLEGGWHEELAVERLLGPNAALVMSVFRDRSRHTAVFGRGLVNHLDFFHDFFSDGFSYDGGELNAWGTRLAYRQKFSNETEATLVYALAAALVQELSPALDLREMLEARNRHSFAGRVATRIPKTHTSLAASYKWIHGPVASRQDAFGEVTHQLDPHLNLSFRQPLPTFLFPGKWEALADFRNLLAQGYVSVTTSDGQVLLIPAFRSFRGGFSIQF